MLNENRSALVAAGEADSVVPSKMEPPALAARDNPLQCSVTLNPFVWKWLVLTERLTGPVPVQETSTETVKLFPLTSSTIGTEAVTAPEDSFRRAVG